MPLFSTGWGLRDFRSFLRTWSSAQETLARFRGFLENCQDLGYTQPTKGSCTFQLLKHFSIDVSFTNPSHELLWLVCLSSWPYLSFPWVYFEPITYETANASFVVSLRQSFLAYWSANNADLGSRSAHFSASADFGEPNSKCSKHVQLDSRLPLINPISTGSKFWEDPPPFKHLRT